MQNTLQVYALILPVFAVLFCGMAVRRLGWMDERVENGLVALVVRLFYPCLIVRSMVEADSLADSPGLLWAPFAGFGSVVLGFAFVALLGRAFGYENGKGLRTFAFAVGICNYGYLPIPMIENLFGANELAVLFLHNVGVETAIWSVGVSFVAGVSFREGLRRILNPMVFALLIGLGLNLSGLGSQLPAPLGETLRMLGTCAIPLGLLAIGANLHDSLHSRESLWDARDFLLGVALRLGAIPLALIAAVWLLPLELELKRVLVIQAAMPAGIMPIVLAKHYGGRPVVAVRVVLATTAVAFLTMPLWIGFGLGILGQGSR